MIIDIRFEVEDRHVLRKILQAGKDHSLLDYKILQFSPVPVENKTSELFGGGNTGNMGRST